MEMRIISLANVLLDRTLWKYSKGNQEKYQYLVGEFEGLHFEDIVDGDIGGVSSDDYSMNNFSYEPDSLLLDKKAVTAEIIHKEMPFIKEADLISLVNAIRNGEFFCVIDDLFIEIPQHLTMDNIKTNRNIGVKAWDFYEKMFESHHGVQ